MTTEDLKQYYTLPIQIDVLKIQLEKLKDESESVVPEISDMPHNPNVSNRVEKYATAIHDLENRIKQNEVLYWEIHRFIYSIPNPYIQTIFITKYANAYNWENVADAMGEGKDAKYYEDKVWKYFNRRNKKAVKAVNAVDIC